MKNILFLVTLIVSPVFAQAEEANNCGANDFALQILGSGGPFGNGRASAAASNLSLLNPWPDNASAYIQSAPSANSKRLINHYLIALP